MNIVIDPDSGTPKYIQIADAFCKLASERKLKPGEILPPINKLADQCECGRVTIVNAYNELKKRGLAVSSHGKGFYIRVNNDEDKIPVLLLFDAMNGYKEVLYRSFIKALGKKYQVDIYFYYYNQKEFIRIINQYSPVYQHVVVLPHFNYDISRHLINIPKEKLLFMDNDVRKLNDGYAAIYQNFYKDTFEGLKGAQTAIKKYAGLKFVLQDPFQFVPNGILDAYKTFCIEQGFEPKILMSLKRERIKSGNAYFIISDVDLISVIRFAKDQGLTLGQDIGIISYDDTPLKEFLAGGITAISTDFHYMGKMAAKMIRKEIFNKIENPSGLILRNSL